MAKVTLHNDTDSSSMGELPPLDNKAPDFTLVASDLSEKTLADFQGKRKLLNIVPSLDTDVCAASARKFNQEAGNIDNTVVLVISADLPFAQGRFCQVEGLDNVMALSTFRSSFGKDYQVEIVKGPLAGLMSRAVVILDEENHVIYTEQVADITMEPDYNKALQVLR